MEAILKGQPWLFRKQVILFDRVKGSIDRKKLRLSSSPFWIKACPCPPESVQKDFAHAIGSSFGGVLGSEIKRDFCYIKVALDVEKPLRRGVFVSTEFQGKY